MLRSIIAVVAGSVVWMITALGTDVTIMRLAPHWVSHGGRIESVPVLLLMLVYSLGYSILGGYVTALIARHREVEHTLALGVLQLIFGLIATAQYYDTAPFWYHMLFLTLLIPANVLGGKLRAGQKR